MAPAPLKVMSWNIGQMYLPNLSFMRYIFPFLNRGVLPSKYLPTIAETIKEVSPHIVCLQEVRKAKYNPERVCQLKRLERSLGGEYKGFYGPHTDEGEHRALLIKHKFTLDKRFKIENISDKKEGVGIAAYVPQKDTWIVNLHFEHYNIWTRQRQLDRIARWVQEKKENVILAGDYNMRKTMHLTERYKKQVQEFFAKMQEKYKFRDASTNLNHTHFFRSKLDYFLTNFPQRKKEKTVLLSDKRWRFMDHYPLVGEFFINKMKEHAAKKKARPKMKRLFALPR
jgi:endonuclease/exonuclease/phosphatase family metal-dependent hydrolase